jgi:flagellar biosynthesis/type III secretory pathway M-ring protein FliF/YscJ
MIHILAFYLFAVMTIASGAITILSRNPVHSVLWLILAFFNAAGLMILVGAEFIAMLLVIVYVGAQFGKVDVEHHDHEQEQHRDRAHIDDDQQHGDELRAQQQHQARRIEEGEDQPQHAMDRVARENRQRTARHHEGGKEVKG